MADAVEALLGTTFMVSGGAAAFGLRGTLEAAAREAALATTASPCSTLGAAAGPNRAAGGGGHEAERSCRVGGGLQPGVLTPAMPTTWNPGHLTRALASTALLR